jgi:hypothetical protein
MLCVVVVHCRQVLTHQFSTEGLTRPWASLRATLWPIRLSISNWSVMWRGWPRAQPFATAKPTSPPPAPISNLVHQSMSAPCVSSFSASAVPGPPSRTRPPVLAPLSTTCKIRPRRDGTAPRNTTDGHVGREHVVSRGQWESRAAARGVATRLTCEHLGGFPGGIAAYALPAPHQQARSDLRTPKQGLRGLSVACQAGRRSPKPCRRQACSQGGAQSRHQKRRGPALARKNGRASLWGEGLVICVRSCDG